MKIVGIDVGTYSIKVVEIKNSNQHITVQSMQEYPLSVDPTKDKALEIIEILRKISEQHSGDTETHFACGVPSRLVSIHRMIQPPAPRFKILESIPFALADVSPLDPDDALHDVRILKTHPNGHEVLAIATRREHVKQALQTFNDGGIDPQVLTVQGLATNNIFENIFAAPLKDPTPVEFDDLDMDDEGGGSTSSHKSSAATAADSEEVTKEFSAGESILILGHTSTTLIVRREGELIECREISWGGHDLITAICNEYKIHYLEGLQMLQKSGVVLLKDQSPSPDLTKLSNTLKVAMLPLLKELQISLLEIKSKYRVQVRAVGLLGGTSRLRNIGPYLTQHLQIATNVISGIHQFPELNFKAENAPIAHMTALGVALEGLRKPRNPALDLRKQEFSIANENLKIFFDRWSYTLRLLGVSFILILAWGIMRSNWSFELSELALRKMKDVGSEATGLPKAQANVSNLNRYIRDSQRRQDLLEKLQNLENYQQASYFLRELHNKVPPRGRLKIDIDSLNIGDRKLFISGRAESTAQLLSLEEALRALSSQNKISKRVVSGSNAEGQTPFEYEININPLPKR